MRSDLLDMYSNTYIVNGHFTISNQLCSSYFVFTAAYEVIKVGDTKQKLLLLLVSLVSITYVSRE